MASPRVTYAMAQAGAFFPSFGRLHPRFGTPSNSILLQTALSILVLLLGSFDRVLAYIIFSAVLFLAISASTLFRTNEPVQGWWFPVAPFLFIAFCIVVAMLILLHNPMPAMIGVGIVLCGVPIHQLLNIRQNSMPLTSEGE
jgi:APA family basic amino acid/polyamine antiporter